MELKDLLRRVREIDEEWESLEMEKAYHMISLKKFYWEIILKDSALNIEVLKTSNPTLFEKLEVDTISVDDQYIPDAKIRALRSRISKEGFLLLARILGNRIHIESEVSLFRHKYINDED